MIAGITNLLQSRRLPASASCSESRLSSTNPYASAFGSKLSKTSSAPRRGICCMSTSADVSILFSYLHLIYWMVLCAYNSVTLEIGACDQYDN